MQIGAPDLESTPDPPTNKALGDHEEGDEDEHCEEAKVASSSCEHV